jgi:hypothetical protein
MAALSTLNPTLLDLAKRTDPNNSIATVVELLNETNEILDDMTWLEGNLPTGHRVTMRTGIPEPVARRLNMYVKPSKSTTAQVTFNTGMFENWAVVDKALADLNGNTAAFRMSEELPILEGFNQKIARTLFFGNEQVDDAEFTGLSAYYNDKGADNVDNIVDAGGTGNDNGSIWLVVWGPNTVHGIVPKGSQAGMQRTDEGLVTLQDDEGGFMRAYRSHYRWDAGLALKDWRYVVRIPNIDKTDLSIVFDAGEFATGAHLPNLMFQAMRRVPTLSGGRPVFYMSRDMLTILQQQTSAATVGSTLTAENVGGKFVERFNGIPIRRVDVLSADETRVV